jgi:hypothetical protein
MMLRTCFSTVPSVTQSWWAMPALERPSAMVGFLAKAELSGRAIVELL